MATEAMATMPVPAGSRVKPPRTPADAGVFPFLEFLVKHSNHPCVLQLVISGPGLQFLLEHLQKPKPGSEEGLLN